MPRRRSRLWTVAVVLVVLPVVVVAAARMLRHSTSPPEMIGRVQRERNLFTDIYGARTPSGVILFDAGVDQEGTALDRLLGALNATRDDVSQVFLTHGHFDHVSASPLCTHAKIRVGAPDVEFLAGRAPMIAPVAGKMLRAIFPPPPVETTDPLVGLVEIPVGGADKVLALPTPGHTPGSYVFVFDKMLFAGDSMIIDGDKLDFCMRAFSIDPAANHRGIAALAQSLAGVDVQTVCTGHMGCTPPGRGAAMLAELLERAAKEAKSD
ncbi:MAG TPA: MBL fold metallo-hydrolase [Polyangia bacterium]|jgi:glyoxylase-like metal-dependent hydrolase (beta-lactamase superfamily II)